MHLSQNYIKKSNNTHSRVHSNYNRTRSRTAEIGTLYSLLLLFIICYEMHVHVRGYRETRKEQKERKKIGLPPALREFKAIYGH